MKTVASVAFWILVLAQSAPAAEEAFPPARGNLNLALTVRDYSGVNRPGEVTTGGVPMPRGLLQDTNRLRVVGPDGRPVPCQFTVMDRWWIEKDPSIRWLLVDFVADVPATEERVYFLRDDGGKTAPTALKVTETDGKVTVVTGPLKFSVSKTAFNVIDEAWYDQDGDGAFSPKEQYIKSSPDNGGVVTSGAWPAQGYKKGEKYYSATKPPRIFKVEEQGACRVVIRVDGTHHARQGGSPDGLYDYRCRIEAFAGSPGVKVSYSISNMRVAETWKTPPIANFEVGTKLEIGDDHAVQFMEENDPMLNPPYVWQGTAQTFADKWRAGLWGRLCSDSRVTLYQDSSGGEQWKNLTPNGFNKRIFGGDTVPGVKFRGFQVTKGGKVQRTGRRSPGQIDIRKNGYNEKGPLKNAVRPPKREKVDYANRGLILTFRDFWQHYPKALYGEKGRIAAKIFPEDSGRTFHVNRGSCRTHQMQFFFRWQKLYRAHYDWLWAQFHNPLVLRAPVGWYARTEAYDMGVARTAAIPLSTFDKQKLDGVRVGSEAYGWISPWNPGGHHWNEAAQFVPWVARGDWRAFQHAEVCTWWARDLVQIQNECPEERIPRFYMYLLGWRRMDENKIKELFYPGYVHTTKWIGIPDSGHAGMLMFLEHYRLTGDRFSRDAIERMGLRGRTHSWKRNYPSAWKSFLKDPDKEPFTRETMSHNRYDAWPLFNFMQGISLSGSKKQIAEARKLVLAYRNAVRYSPIGYLCLQVNDKGSPEVYGRGFAAAIRNKGASANYGSFQFGLVVIALSKYYEESGDEEALDTILATCDVMAKRALLRDKDGKPLGWSYSWGDIWGPNGQRGSWNDELLTTLGYGYRFSGRKDFLEILKAGYKETKDYYRPFSQVGYACVVHPRKDQTPPAPITDLEARATGNGAAKLSWTAPGGDGRKGRAARYQLKYSRVKMVEHVTDWPTPGVALPADKASYRKMANEHLAKVQSFYQAYNVTDEPAPKKAGAKENYEAKGLEPGTYWFAVKGFDAARNISDISNVVKVEVK
jgi:hypothetical protein